MKDKGILFTILLTALCSFIVLTSCCEQDTSEDPQGVVISIGNKNNIEIKLDSTGKTEIYHLCDDEIEKSNISVGDHVTISVNCGGCDKIFNHGKHPDFINYITGENGVIDSPDTVVKIIIRDGDENKDFLDGYHNDYHDF